MGRYVNRILLNNESVVFETQHHWIHYLTLRGVLSLFILPTIDHYVNEFVITNQRVIIKKGWLFFWSLEMNHNQIEAIFVHQNLLGRILDYGTIEVSGTGGTRKKFNQISAPNLFRQRFQETINNL